MKSIAIIGGGIVGLCSAYYLSKEGHDVTIFDQSNFSTGASYVNAGYITPSHIISLAAPGIINKGLRWMFNSASPFYMKPRLDKDFLAWVFAFKKSSNQRKVTSSIPVIRDINLLSRELYADMKSSGDFDFHLDHKGLLMVYQSEKVGEQEWVVGQRAIEAGLKVSHYSQSELKELEPRANLNAKGAVFYDCDAHMTPVDFMRDMLQFLKGRGVQIFSEETVEQIVLNKNKVSKIKTDQREFKADAYVLAAGSWTAQLARKLGLRMLLQAGKGYRINVHRETGISIPTVLCEAKCAVTPMQGYTRFAGTMEFSGINHKIRKERVQAIANAASRYYPDLSITNDEKKAVQCGLRPVSPDGLPYIGKSSKCENLIFATGHAMMGWSLGPATGKLVTDILMNKNPSLNLDPFHPERKF